MIYLLHVTTKKDRFEQGIRGRSYSIYTGHALGSNERAAKALRPRGSYDSRLRDSDASQSAEREKILKSLEGYHLETLAEMKAKGYFTKEKIEKIREALEEYRRELAKKESTADLNRPQGEAPKGS